MMPINSCNWSEESGCRAAARAGCCRELLRQPRPAEDVAQQLEGLPGEASGSSCAVCGAVQCPLAGGPGTTGSMRATEEARLRMAARTFAGRSVCGTPYPNTLRHTRSSLPGSLSPGRFAYEMADKTFYVGLPTWTPVRVFMGQEIGCMQQRAYEGYQATNEQNRRAVERNDTLQNQAWILTVGAGAHGKRVPQRENGN
ncbi:hypothetical protein Efla_006077 [Eimeria flavescens]